jgi:membrane protein required for colicin V production
METYDIIMLIILAATTIFGGIKGFAWQLASVASIVVSYLVAYWFRYDVAKMINADPPWNLFLAMLLLYFGTSFAIWMIFRLVSTSIDKVKLKEFDRHLGAGFGLLKGVLLCLIITMFAMTLLGPSQQQRIANSRSGYYISKILASADGVLPDEIKQVVGPYIDNVERRLQAGQSGQIPPGYPVSNQNGAGQGGLLDGLKNMIEERGISNPFGGGNNNGNSNNPGGMFPNMGGGQGGAGQNGPSQNGAGQGSAWEFGGGNFAPPPTNAPQNNWGLPSTNPPPPNGGDWPILPR